MTSGVTWTPINSQSWCYLDLRQHVFDTVDQHILLNRLKDLVGPLGTILKWFYSYLSLLFCKYGYMLRNPINCGVSQVLILGTVLFNLYLLSLGYVIKKHINPINNSYTDNTLYFTYKILDFI